MSGFENLKTVHPSERNFASFFSSCAFRLPWENPSTSTAIFLSGSAKSIL